MKMLLVTALPIRLILLQLGPPQSYPAGQHVLTSLWDCTGHMLLPTMSITVINTGMVTATIKAANMVLTVLDDYQHCQ